MTTSNQADTASANMHPKDTSMNVLGIIQQEAVAFAPKDGNIEVVTPSDESSNEATPSTDPANETPSPKETATTPTSTISQDEFEKAQKRYSDLKSYHDKEMNRINAEREAEKEKYNELQRTKAEELLSSTDIKDFEAKYGEFAGYVEAKVSASKADAEKELLATRAEAKKAEGEVAKMRGLQYLQRNHPEIDMFTIQENPQFAAWYEKQKPYVQQMVMGNDLEATSDALDMFKRDTGLVKTKEKKQQEEAVDAAKAVESKGSAAKPTGKAPEQFLESDFRKMGNAYQRGVLTLKQFDEWEAKFEAARREGRVTYDLSGR